MLAEETLRRKRDIRVARPLAPGASSAPPRLARNEQDRDGAVAHDELGVAAEQQAVYAAPAVRAHDDQVRAPALRLVDDRRGDTAGRILQQDGLRPQLGAPGVFGCFRERALA